MIKNKFLAALLITSAISTTASFSADFDFENYTGNKISNVTDTKNALDTGKKYKTLWQAAHAAGFDAGDLTPANKKVLTEFYAAGLDAADLTPANKKVLTEFYAAGLDA